MAYIATTNAAPTLLSLIKRPFQVIWTGLIYMAEHNPRMTEVRRLSDTTDAQLEARGTTRSDEVRRIFADRFYL